MRFLELLVLTTLLLAVRPARAEHEHPLGHALELLAEVTPYVEKACGAKFESPPRVVALSEPSAAAVFAEDMRPEYDRRYAQLPPAQRENLLKLGALTSVRSCLARYSFNTHNVIVVRTGFDAQCASLKVSGERATQLLRVALAHECVHALDDARFSLSSLYRKAADDEALRAVAMIAEGRAVHFGRIAATEAGAPQDLVDLLPGGDAPKSERDWLIHLTYRLGARFVGALVARSGVAMADQAIASPPATTWSVCVPSRWPDGKPDERPGKTLAKAGFGEAAHALSDLQLRARYAAMKDLATAERLFENLSGGAQALVAGTNSAVLSFADEESAKRFEEVSRAETRTERRGTVVVRAIGEDQEIAVHELAAALDEGEKVAK